MSYPGDDNYEFFLANELYDYEPALRDDAGFQDRLHDLFDYDLLEDFAGGAEDAYNELAAYLDEYYDIDLEVYWDWDDWRDAYNAA